ncbi:SDR family NAD(P)-dependent oxidoreductase [Sorangium sp. So ce590]|uniref:SDR family NAD(P)-dependent oxidoreductase n=1 Tax=unclassified Sorangium TaxID=2621164 RepID=UPI003F5DD66C
MPLLCVPTFPRRASEHPNLDILLCDLSRMADVKRAAEEFKAKHDRLDVLVDNAGATFKKPTIGPDGLELTFALDHLAYFLLTTSLLALIRKTPGARVVSTSSSMQARGKLDLAKTPTSPEAASLKGEYISKRRPATPQKQAMDPKLAADLWTSSEKLGAEAAARAARGNA